ncbi:MAG: proline dehydrogenase family protein [Bryobacteraceae bacterium]|nr:proline dehydrogenase family protein [Bryobacterales bacterium]MEB2360066.1 proline dehydrogenase family protein [Bryobacterales bacterium]NUN01297.1 proline dehydrogenase family protein [Bryobacteraceae bacterium]
MLRDLLLYLSTQKHLRNWVETSPLAGRLTSRFIAGNTLEEALAVGARLNAEGLLVTLDHLGENVTSEVEANASRDAYLQALVRIGQLGLRSTVSIKLSQFGLDVSEQLCRENVAMVVEQASRTGTWVEVDMEASRYVDATLALVREMHSRHQGVRAVIQSYLRRSEHDVEQLCRDRIPVRVCKGAYKEDELIAFPQKTQVDANYLRLSQILLERGVYPGMATHDPKMVQGVLGFVSKLGISPQQFEFQMLYGIRRDLQRMLIRRGFRLRLYVPYGSAWYPYFMRRLAERPANVLFLARNLFR